MARLRVAVLGLGEAGSAIARGCGPSRLDAEFDVG